MARIICSICGDRSCSDSCVSIHTARGAPDYFVCHNPLCPVAHGDSVDVIDGRFHFAPDSKDYGLYAEIFGMPEGIPSSRSRYPPSSSRGAWAPEPPRRSRSSRRSASRDEFDKDRSVDHLDGCNISGDSKPRCSTSRSREPPRRGDGAPRRSASARYPWSSRPSSSRGSYDPTPPYPPSPEDAPPPSYPPRPPRGRPVERDAPRGARWADSRSRPSFGPSEVDDNGKVADSGGYKYKNTNACQVEIDEGDGEIVILPPAADKVPRKDAGGRGGNYGSGQPRSTGPSRGGYYSSYY
ncbi:hypothetical protein GQ53DRAFT_774106 [Thozetella sp. PMI_491]|nr:hypothetical protein GQ53DRAFT_774106 [Thozetella sp. PMI_491]